MRFGFIGLLALIMILPACGFYTFTGASIPLNAKSVSIEYFDNKARLIEPTLSQTITDALRDKFSTQTTLDVINKDGDLQIEGYISDYNTKPQEIQGNQTASTNRLTIVVTASYTNLLDESKSYKDVKFSRYEDYSADKSLDEVKEGLIATILEVIVEDIFNRAVVNW